MRQLALALSFTATLASSATAQTLGHGAEVQVSYWRVAAALLLCLALAVGAAFALRARYATRGRPLTLADLMGRTLSSRAASSQRCLELVDRLRVNPQLEICLLVCEGRRYLIASSANGAVVLDKDLPPAPVDAGAPS